MSAPKVSSLLAALLALSVVNSIAENASSTNNSKPVVFLTSQATSNSSDSGNSESRLNQKIITELPVGHSNPTKKQVVSSQGYQLEVIDDDTSEEGQERSGQAQKGSEQQLNIYSASGLNPSLIDHYLQPEYDDNSAKEDKDEYIPRGKLAYGDIKPKSDINKVRDIFVNKEMNNKEYAEQAYAPQSESKYKYVNTPIVLKQANLPLVEASPRPLPIQLGEDEIGGHTAGYGHGFHHHQQKLKSKPLKPSVVYRDPKDRFDHDDKIRTLDKDHLDKGPHHHYEPHGVKGHEFNAYRHGKKVYEPEYHYDQTKIPECAHKNKYIYNLTFCLDDPHYPTKTIIWALKEAGYHAKKLLSDVTYQSADNLVTGLTRAEEEGYTYKHYFGASYAQNVHLDKYKPPYHGYSYSTDYFKKGGYICPSDIYYARPKRAMNTFGKWKVIVNVDHLPEYGHDGYDGHDSYGKGHDHDHHGKGHDHYGKGHEHDHYGKGQEQNHYGKRHEHDHYGKGHDHYGKGHEHDSYGKHHEHDSYGKGHGHDSYGKGHEHDKYGKHHELDSYGKGHGKEHGHLYFPDPDAHSIKKREYKEYKKTYTQTLRLEQCIYPNAPCSYIDSHYHSKCIQKHNFVRLVAWTHDEGIHVDTFKMPIACSCHVHQPIHFFHESGHHEHKHGHVVPPVHAYHGHEHPHQPSEAIGVIKKIY